MAIDNEILLTLQRIEKIFKVPSRGAVAGIANKAINDNNDRKTTRTFLATTKNLNIFGNSLDGATNSAERFRRTLRRTDDALNQLNKRVNRTSFKPSNGKNTTATSTRATNDFEKSLDDLNKTIDAVANPARIINRLNGPTGLYRQLTSLTANVRLLNRAFANKPGTTQPQPQPSFKPGNTSGATAGAVGGALAAVAPNLSPKSKGFVKRMSEKIMGVKETGQANEQLGKFATEVGSTATGLFLLSSAVKGVKNVFGQVVFNDMFQTLAARGYGAADSLVTLYKNSIKSGMSLQEYTKMMDDSMNVVSRSRSFDDFQKNLDDSNQQLLKFGIFGPEATEMSAAMQSATASFGVPMQDMGGAVNKQIAVFEKLRKTTNITSEGFTELIKSMRDDTNIQSELLGLNQQDRAARAADILQTTAYGNALNLTTQQQNQVADALKASRHTAIKQRFQQAGVISQTGAMTGQSDADTQELRGLSLMRIKTDEQNKRFLELDGNQLSVLQTMLQSGDAQTEANAQAMLDKRDSVGLGATDTAATTIALAKDAGPINNSDLNKQTGILTQNFMALSTQLEGLSKNPIASMVASGVGTLVSTMIGGVVFAEVVGGRIGAVVARYLGVSSVGGAFRGRGGSMGPPRPSVENGGIMGPSRPTSKMGRAWNATKRLGGSLAGEGSMAAESLSLLKMPGVGKMLGTLMRGAGVVGTVASVGSSLFSFFGGPTPEERAAKGEEGGDAGKIRGQDWGELSGQIVGGGIGALLGGPLGIWLGSMIGGPIGKWAGGLIGAESATEKNTRLMKENTEALRKTAGSNTISADNMGSVAANVMQTAKAYADPKINNPANVAATVTAPTDASANVAATVARPNPDALAASFSNDYIDSGLNNSIVAATSGRGGIIGTPVSVPPTSVTTGDVNKVTTDAILPGSTDAGIVGNSATTTPPAQTSHELLQQILLTLRQGLDIDGKQLDSQVSLLRAVGAPTLSSTSLVDRLFRLN